jgi:hypothetical protein
VTIAIPARDVDEVRYTESVSRDFLRLSKDIPRNTPALRLTRQPQRIQRQRPQNTRSDHYVASPVGVSCRTSCTTGMMILALQLIAFALRRPRDTPAFLAFPERLKGWWGVVGYGKYLFTDAVLTCPYT